MQAKNLMMAPLASRQLSGTDSRRPDSKDQLLRHLRRPSIFQAIQALPGQGLSRILNQQGAERLHATVVEHPGSTIRQAARRSGLPKDRLGGILAALVASGHVMAIHDGAATAFFPSLVGLDEACCRQFLALRNPHRAFLYRRMSERPLWSRASLIQQAEAEWGWHRRSTEERLAVLLRLGLVEVVPAKNGDQRLVWLRTRTPMALAQRLFEVSHGRLAPLALLQGSEPLAEAAS